MIKPIKPARNAKRKRLYKVTGPILMSRKRSNERVNECVRNRSHTLRNYMSKKLSKDSSSVVVVMSVVGCETEHGAIGARAGLVTW